MNAKVYILASREAEKLTVAAGLSNGFAPSSKDGSNMVNNDHTDTEALHCTQCTLLFRTWNHLK